METKYKLRENGGKYLTKKGSFNKLGDDFDSIYEMKKLISKWLTPDQPVPKGRDIGSTHIKYTYPFWLRTAKIIKYEIEEINLV